MAKIIPKLASTILLVRDVPSFEVLMVQRHHQIDFAPNALVFPGGKLDPQDVDPAWERHTSEGDLSSDERALRVCALREAFEESGVLLVQPSDRRKEAAIAAATACRAQVCDGSITFLELVTKHELALDLTGLKLFARWITPPIAPKRFDTHFFVAAAPAALLAVCDGRETVDAQWLAPAEALRRKAAGECNVLMPTALNLQRLAESINAADALIRAQDRACVPVHPQIEERDGEAVVRIPAECGYGEIVAPLAALR